TDTVNSSGTFSGLSGKCVVTGTAALEVGLDRKIPIIINGGTSATLTCTAYVCTIPPSGTQISGGAVSWNHFNTVGSNDVVWINAHIGKPNGIPANEATTVQFTEVTDMSERGVQGIGFLGGVRRQDKGPRTPEPNTTKPATPLGE